MIDSRPHCASQD